MQHHKPAVTDDGKENPYVLGILAITLTMAALFGLTQILAHYINMLFHVQFFTPEQFRECATTIAIVAFVTMQAPLAVCAIIHHIAQRKRRNT